MAIVRIFSGSYCRGEEIVEQTVQTLGCRAVDDAEVVARAAERFGVAAGRLQRTLDGGVSAFDNFTHERQRNRSCLKLIVAELLGGDDFVLAGSAGQLVPAEISHVLRVCIIADLPSRYQRAVEVSGATLREAQRLVHKDDERRVLWTEYVLGKSPWDAELYDVFLPTHQVEVREAVELICRSAANPAVRPTEASRRAAADFHLAARVEVALGKAGHDVAVAARQGKVTLTINKHALMLSRLEEELKGLAAEVEGVAAVETQVGPGFYRPGIYRQFNPVLPNKVLLVDDEQEFVQTLSERLQMRDFGSTVVYDGEQALSFVDREEPEVIVLDLRMPGIDGIEVLRRIKQEHERIEVIVLTGHGSAQDEETCRKLGAFAYLQKPVDIARLSEVMQEAYCKVRAKQAGKDEAC